MKPVSTGPLVIISVLMSLMVVYLLKDTVLYFLNFCPDTGHDLFKKLDGQVPVDPDPEVYGSQSSETIPVIVIYDQALSNQPPLHPIFPLSHETISWGDKTTLIAPFEAMQNLSDNASEAPKAQHDPQLCWFLTA